jgi:hypothetical protein
LGVQELGGFETGGRGAGVHESGVHKLGVDGSGDLGLGVQELGDQPSGDHVAGNQDCVVLDIGGEVGALILYAPAELSGAEIEVSGTGSRTHSIVRERRVDQNADGRRTAGRHAAPSGPGNAAVYAAVYPGLPAGLYTIWRDAQTPAGTVKVEGGQVASWLWE